MGPSTARVVDAHNINDGEWRLFDISSVLMSGLWDWMADIVTVIDIMTRYLADG